MQELDQHSITDAVLDQMSATENPRLKEVMEVVVRHLHEIAREVDLRPSELFAAMQFLMETGQKCTPQRQEFLILSAVLGLESVVNSLDDVRTGERGTRTGIFGPFYLADAPVMKNGQSLAGSDKGNQIALYGTVTDSSGKPIQNASVEIWQTDEEGLYDVQRQEEHFRLSAPGYRSLITALYLKSDEYIESDTAFGVTDSLVRDIVDHDPNSPFPDLPAVNFDFVLRSADVPAAVAAQ